MNKIIVIESSTDGSGKQTQTDMLYNKLKSEGEKVVRFSFPNYESDSSIFVKKYLHGEFGEQAEKLDPYIISTFFSIDRYITYIKEIQKYIEEDYYIILDRYTTSNMVYQASKIENEEEVKKYIKWLKEFEYDLYKLPKPGIVIYLHLTVEKSQELIKNRNNKINNAKEKDIHERDVEYLKKSYKTAEIISKLENWERIECVKNGVIKTKEEISKEIFKKIQKNYCKEK